MKSVSKITKRDLTNPDTVELQLLHKYIDHATICTADHMRYCPCQNILINELCQKAEEKHGIYEDMDKFQIAHKQNMQRNAVIKNLGKYNQANNIRCVVEAGMIKDILKVFDDKQTGDFDMSKTHVFIMVKTMLNHLMSSHRLQIRSNADGMVQTRQDENGNAYFIINPVEKVKMEFDKEIASTMEKLFKMDNGIQTKNLNINVNLEPIPIEDLYKDDTIL